MGFFRSSTFKWLMGEFDKVPGNSSGLALSDGDANAGTLGKGVICDYAANSHTVFAMLDGKGIGILESDVDQYGVNTDAHIVRRQFDKNVYDIPIKKGQPVSLIVPHPNSMAEFEGLGAGSYNNKVITATTTGFLSSGTTRHTQLSSYKGGWRTAQSGDLVLALLEQANLTPETAGNLRIRVRFVSPYVLA
jgi:hypothetical protein